MHPIPMRLALAMALLPCATAAHATGRCKVSVAPDMAGFFLTPTIQRLRVVRVTPPSGGRACELQVDDAIVRIDAQPVEGQKARVVMAYWDSLPADAPRTFTVRRDGRLVTVPVP